MYVSVLAVFKLAARRGGVRPRRMTFQAAAGPVGSIAASNCIFLFAPGSLTVDVENEKRKGCYDAVANPERPVAGS